MKKIVITGALGHIGSLLIREIPKAFLGCEIFMVDNLSTQRFFSLFDLPRRGRYRFLQADILDADLDEMLKGAGALIHLAAITDAASSHARRDEVLKVNYEGTERVARACLAADVPIVFFSTTSVYGTQENIVDENCPSEDLKPQSPYAESKLKAENALQSLGASGLRYVICRFGTIAGVSPGMRFHTAVNQFCWQAVMRQPITVWRTALCQKRPYLSLRDALGAVFHILRRSLWDGEIYNVVTDNLTVEEILKMISKKAPHLNVRHVDTEIMNQLSYAAAKKKFEATGFRFKGRIEKDIWETIELLANAQSRHGA